MPRHDAILEWIEAADYVRLSELLDANPQLKQNSRSGEPLLHAALRLNREAIAWLLTQGVDPDQQDLLEDTVLMCASCDDDVDVAAVLIEHGADANLQKANGDTAFSYACAYNGFACAQFLFEHGAKINTVDKGGGSPLDWAVCHASQEFRDWLIRVGGRRHDDTYPPWPPPENQEGAGKSGVCGAGPH